MWFIHGEPRGAVFERLIDCAAKMCTSFLLVMRCDFDISENCREVLSRLEPFLIDYQEQYSWPGTALMYHTAMVNYYTLTKESKEILTDCSNGLYSWIHPDLPEDLCFLKADGSPWLSNIAHDKISYFESLEKSEIEELSKIGIKIVKDLAF